MRYPLLVFWLLLPFAAWAYHEGPGQVRVKLDEVDVGLVSAEAAIADEDWEAAIKAYETALEELPEDHVGDQRRIRLALNQARMMFKQLPVARDDLDELVAEMIADADADQSLLDEARTALASSQYYITWLMRLEGHTRQEWEPEIEAARQTYRLVAERADARGDLAVADRRREDVESALVLARMDLEELQGLPLPNQ